MTNSSEKMMKLTDLVLLKRDSTNGKVVLESKIDRKNDEIDF